MPMGLEQDWRGLLRSIATYSRIPLKINWDSPVKHTPSVCFLPWVGAIVALLSAWPLLFSSWSSEFQALLMLISAVLITGAFHEDGLMDACDGLVGGWTPEQRLTIMKDSRVGSYGVLAAVFSFAMKWWLLSQWLASGTWHLDEYAVLAGWIVLHVAARWLPLWIMCCANYVSQGGSKARSMLSPMTKRAWLWVILSMVFVWCLVGGSAFARIILALIVCFLAGLLYLKRKIQGYNGDTLGAIEQLGEIAVLFSLLAWQA